MLYEVIEHENNSRVLCYAVQAHKRTMHYHRELEILYVMQGEIHSAYNGQHRMLHPHEIVIIESDALHEVYSSDPTNTLLVLQIRPDYFYEFCPHIFEARFQQHVLQPSDGEIYRKLRKGLSDIVEQYQHQSPSRSFHLIRLACEMLIHLMENLSLNPHGESISKSEEMNLRLSRIIRHIDANCSGPVSLKEIADSEGVNLYYLSHFFHDRLGMTFQEFVTHRRLHNAEHMLTRTDKNLTTVSRECGFSDPRYLKRAFRDEYGIDLKEYMKNRFNSAAFRDPLTVGSNYPVNLSAEDILRILNTKL